MADYPTFVVVHCQSRKPIMTTSSARKANSMLCTGYRVEIWNHNRLVAMAYGKDRDTEPLMPYIMKEKEYIRNKQKLAEARNAQRRENKLKRLMSNA